MKVAVELTRTCDAACLVQALTSHGLRAQADRSDGRVLVEADDLAGVEHALEDWIVEQGVPFVPFHVDGRTLALAPPPG